MKNAYVLHVNSKSFSQFYIQISSVSDLTNMIEIGLDLPIGTFTEAGQCGFVFKKIIIHDLFTYVSDVVLTGHTY